MGGGRRDSQPTTITERKCLTQMKCSPFDHYISSIANYDRSPQRQIERSCVLEEAGPAFLPAGLNWHGDELCVSHHSLSAPSSKPVLSFPLVVYNLKTSGGAEIGCVAYVHCFHNACIHFLTKAVSQIYIRMHLLYRWQDF